MLRNNRKPLVIGDPANVTTLNHLLYLYGLVPNRTIDEVMDTRGVLCYNYV
jgi:tyrosinase